LRRHPRRRTLFVIALVAVLAQLWSLNNLMVLQPGLAAPAADFVHVSTPHAHGRNLVLTAVVAKRADALQVVRALFDSSVELRSRSDHLPDGVPWSEYNAVLAELMSESQSVAAAVALRHLGYRVEARPVHEASRPHQSVTYHIDLPRDISFAADGIVGASAGLMLALEVYDQLVPGELVSNVVIAGTGALRLDGSVEAVNGVRQKVYAAESYGASIFLAPRANVAEAVAAAQEIEVIGVDTFEQAIRLLQAIDGRGLGHVHENNSIPRLGR